MTKFCSLSLKNLAPYGKPAPFIKTNMITDRELITDKTVFLPLLEKLGKSDETVVREQSIRSLCKISEHLSDAEMQNVFCPLVIRLA